MLSPVSLQQKTKPFLIYPINKGVILSNTYRSYYLAINQKMVIACPYLCRVCAKEEGKILYHWQVLRDHFDLSYDALLENDQKVATSLSTYSSSKGRKK